MRRTWFVAAVATLATVVGAGSVTAAPSNNNSEKLRSAVTLAGVKRHTDAFQAIAAITGNRFAGLAGHDQSSQYVYDQLQAAGYSPTFSYFDYDAFVEEVPSTLQQTAPFPVTYVNGVNFRIMTFSGSGDVTGLLRTPSGDRRGCFAADYAGFVPGSIALIERGTPAGFPGGACTFRIKADNARAAGAVAVLIYNNVPGVLNGTLNAPLYSLPVIGLTQSLGLELSLSPFPPTMRVRTQTSSRTLTTRNVLADLPGVENPNNVVVIGAHLDSVTAGPGINDNGSGSAAILETAIQMAKVESTNTVRFAWWSAEESNLIGSTRYVTGLTQAERDKIALNLNFDMVASPNYVRFVYDGDNSTGAGQVGPPGSAAIETLFHDYFTSQGLASAETPFNGRSDYGPFIANGIPAGGLFTGAEGTKSAAEAAVYGGTAGVAYDPCYHAACDTSANLNLTVLDQMADAIAHATITYAQNTVTVNGVAGKGNFKPKPRPAAAPTGSGPAGGLLGDAES